MALLDAPDPETMKGKRDLALLAILVACGSVGMKPLS
jgi:hypothetical protein